jgi:hypothetical protein
VAFVRSLLALLLVLRFCDSAEKPLKPIHVEPIDYPPLAHAALVQGRVKLQARVSSDGGVVGISAKSGHPLLVPAARESLAKWRFDPCSGGESVCKVAVAFVFVIKGDCPNTCKTEFNIDRSDHVTIRAKRGPPMY